MLNIDKNKLKNALKTIFEVFFCIFCIFFLILSPKIVFNETSYALNIDKFLSSEKQSKVVLSIHHIETFEGGSKSRSQFLEKEAMLFNRQHPNIFISIITMTPEQLLLNLKENNLPDLYSFGTGVGEYISGYLIPLEWNEDLISDKKKYCLLQEKILCYPYIQSGYFLITNENLIKNNKNIANFDDLDDNYRIQSVVKDRKLVRGVSIGMGYTSSPSAIQHLSAGQEDCLALSTQYEAYCSFVEGRSVSLLGSMRDVIRCKNREDNGKLSSCIYTVLDTYSDMVQYMAVVDSNNPITLSASKMFASFITSSSQQSHLSDYGLFSCTLGNIYTEEPMVSYERAFRTCSSISAFTPLVEIEQMRVDIMSKIFK